MVLCRMQTWIRMDELRVISVSGALFQADEADIYRWQAAVEVQKVLAYLEKQSADDRIRVIHQKENGGVSEARNRGILEAVGEWIAFLDQDDYYCPDFLSSLLTEADNAEIDMLMAGFSLADLVHLCGLESYLSQSKADWEWHFFPQGVLYRGHDLSASV